MQLPSTASWNSRFAHGLLHLFIAVMSAMLGAAALALQFDADAVQRQAQKTYGQRGAQNVAAWLALLSQQRGQPEDQQLKQINEFWNRRVMGSEDILIWNQADYWATPMQSLGKAAGDCEDFVIGKYFSLIHLGVAPEKLRLIYVRARVGGQSIAHMVLGYYATPDADPLVLDNLSSSIRPASQRRDLTPVFSFNAQGIYMPGAKPASADRIGRWNDLLDRMRKEGFQP